MGVVVERLHHVALGSRRVTHFPNVKSVWGTCYDLLSCIISMMLLHLLGAHLWASAPGPFPSRMHYYNPSLDTGVMDSSGVRVTFANTLRTHDAAARPSIDWTCWMDPLSTGWGLTE